MATDDCLQFGGILLNEETAFIFNLRKHSNTEEKLRFAELNAPARVHLRLRIGCKHWCSTRKAPGIKFGHHDFETVTRIDGVALRMRHKDFESHTIPQQLVRVTRRKSCLAHTHSLDDSSATQLLEHLTTQ
jgi:hypothetical protein